jgi:hypothetical protein
MKKKIFALTMLIPSLLVLSNCEWFKSKQVVNKGAEEAGTPPVKKTEALPGEILLTIEGEPALTVPEYEQFLNIVFEAQPQYKQLMAVMPDAEKEFFQNMATERVLESWVKKNDIDHRADYQRDRQLALEMLDRQLAGKYFQQEYPKHHTIEVTDADARKVYDEKKADTRELIVSPGGINAQGIAFNTEADAKAFVEKVKEPGNTFAKVAKDQNLNVKEFKQVNAQSFNVETPIREKVLAMNKFPKMETIKVKDKVWVVKGTDKEAPQYVPFEQIKDGVKEQLRMQKLLTEGLDNIKKELKVVEHKDYFERKAQAHNEEMQKAREVQTKTAQNEKNKTTDKKSAPKVASNAQVGSVKGA